jgi:Ala-tRNA(Pro) deacylase
MLQWQKIRKKGILMELINGRPEDCSGRLAKEVRCYDLLDSLGVPYQRIDHEAANTMEACAAVDAALGATICKNLLLCNRQCTSFYLLMIPGDKVFKTKDLSAQIGSSRLSFAGGEYMEQFLDITPGSLSVLGLMNDKENKVQLLIDEDVLTGEYIGMHPCINTSYLRLKTKELMESVLPAMGHEAKIVTLPTYPTE